MMRTRASLRWLVLLLLSAQALIASAQTRAWLDRDRIALGETTTLNIETDQATASAPDYSSLMGEFQISNNVSSRQFEIVNGTTRAHVLFAVALQPRREGVVDIPSLVVGGQRTQALSVTVTASTAAPARAGDPVFIESEADAQQPYIQQAVGFTVRLYYSGPISGQLDQPAPDGATLQRVGEDTQYTRQIGDQVYSVLERHFLLIPERSGVLTIPSAHFEGRGAEGFFDDLIGNGGRPMRASSAPRVLRVLPAPAQAPQPWLPLRSLQLRYLATPDHARANTAATVTIEAVADGATAAQLPPLQLAVDGDAQVFAEPAQSDETYADGRPQVRMVRRFSIVPAHAGRVRVIGPRVDWWDVRAGLRRTASLPDLNLQVAAGVANANASTGSAASAGDLPSPQGGSVAHRLAQSNPWVLAAVAFAVAWLLTLLWAVQGRQARAAGAEPDAAIAPAPAQHTVADLKRALDHDDLGQVADVLCALRTPPAPGLDAVHDALDDPRQRDAVRVLQHARWGGGDGSAARATLREAFRHGPRWRIAAAVSPPSPLPPLYPPG
jgi:hypothetical protein